MVSIVVNVGLYIDTTLRNSYRYTQEFVSTGIVRDRIRFKSFLHIAYTDLTTHVLITCENYAGSYFSV